MYENTFLASSHQNKNIFNKNSNLSLDRAVSGIMTTEEYKTPTVSLSAMFCYPVPSGARR
jgi:hypothetical protein